MCGCLLIDCYRRTIAKCLTLCSGRCTQAPGLSRATFVSTLNETHPAECLRFYAGSPRSAFTSCRTLRSESDRFPLQTCPLPISLCVIDHQLNFQGFFGVFFSSKIRLEKKYIEKSLIAASGPAAAFRCSNVSPVKFLHVEETSCGTLSG